MSIEIERKYLIRMPDEGVLSSMPGCQLWEIEQTYLTDGPQGETRRVRKVRCEGRETLYRTEKHRISAMANVEDESEITAQEYASLLLQADPSLQTIYKRRYRIPYLGQMLEIDIYTFWKDQATLEVELADEEQRVVLPDYVKVIREVTQEHAYKNRYLAEHVPTEELN